MVLFVHNAHVTFDSRKNKQENNQSYDQEANEKWVNSNKNRGVGGEFGGRKETKQEGMSVHRGCWVRSVVRILRLLSDLSWIEVLLWVGEAGIYVI
jgi:hypothetical protein